MGITITFTAASPPIDDQIVDRLLQGNAVEADLRRFVDRDPELIVFTLLALQVRLAAANSSTGANTPSSAIPIFQKENAPEDQTNDQPDSGGEAEGAPTTDGEKGEPGKGRKKRKRKPGQPGHKGSHRKQETTPDRTRQHKAPCCPDCQGRLRRTGQTRTRITEDIPEDLKPVLTAEVIHRDYCPKCKKTVIPKIPDVLPRCVLGNRTLVLTAMLHFLQGLTISQVTDTFNFHLRLKLTAGGLVQMWHRLADILFGWYEQIHQESLNSAKLHADETGWRVKGRTHWLWCFANEESCYYMIDRSRGSPALTKFFT